MSCGAKSIHFDPLDIPSFRRRFINFDSPRYYTNPHVKRKQKKKKKEKEEEEKNARNRARSGDKREKRGKSGRARG